MCPVPRSVLIPALLACVVCGIASATAPGVSPTETALRDAGMLDVLEARLLDLLRRAENDDERDKLIERLGGVYTELLRSVPEGSEEHRRITERAWTLAEYAGEGRAVGLRLALLLDSYLPIERAVELYELGLLSEADRDGHIASLRRIHTRFATLAATMVARADLAERTRDGEADDAAIAELIRLRSLSNYYAAWSGLVLSVIEDRPPDAGVLPAFGWLLGAEGGAPTLEGLSGSSLEFEHVARSAIGVGRARAREGESILAGQWFRMVEQSERAPGQVRTQAAFRIVRLLADQGDWIAALRAVYELRGTDDETGPLPVAEARYLAMRSLEHLSRTGATAGEAYDLAALALGDLVARGEIGHVLDLRNRFGRLTMLGEGFVGVYADALAFLADIEPDGSAPMFAEAAARFGRALDADDTGRFPSQRDDAALKQVFCEIRANRPRQALELVDVLITSGLTGEALEEARWLRIVAIDGAEDPRLRPDLTEAVRAYLADYPASPRASRLLVRHAGTEILDPDQSVEGLRAIGKQDPVVLRARRVLVRLMYRVWTDGGRSDDDARAEMARLIEWVWEHDGGADDTATPRERLDLARIALDLSISGSPRLDGLADAALARARAEIDANPSLAVFDAELTLQTVDLLASRGDLAGAERAGAELRASGHELASRADRVLLSAALRRLDETPDDTPVNELALRIGVRVVEEITPPAPGRLSAEASAIVDRVSRVAAGLWALDRSNEALRDLALRLGRIVLERGSPTGQGLRDLAALASAASDEQTEIEAWSLLLAASLPEEPAWWEARYHTLRLLRVLDPAAAAAAYAQHTTLFPSPGPAPWGGMIDRLFDDGGAVAKPTEAEG